MSKYQERRCIQCKYYDGEICTLELNNLNYDYVTEAMYKAPHDTCDDFEEDTEFYEEDE